MKDEGNNDLVERTTTFALRIVRMFVGLPMTEEARPPEWTTAHHFYNHFKKAKTQN
jgi:hypothetical protein